MDPNKRPEDMERITTPELAQAFIDEKVEEVRAQVGDKNVLLALSGGVDSSVVAALLIKAIGKQLICVHVNHGLMRKGESEQVVDVFKNQLDANLVYVDATDRFLGLLDGVAEPDILESDGVKAHHNVGGLPDDLQFELCEPVKLLFKDEVRVIGRELGLPENMVERQPFPGPGLAIRVIGEITEEKLSILRDETTGVRDFREIVGEIATLMCYDATRNLPLEPVEVQTPVAKAVTYQLAGKKLAIVPVLRAGLGMVEGILTLIPSAKVGHIGLFRDPETLEPVKYYCKMPTDIAERDVIILDPMLATGGSASAAITFVKEYGVKNIKLMNILAAPEGIERVRADHPDVEIYVAAVDEKLNEHGYIVPGLGDAGDRILGTK